MRAKQNILSTEVMTPEQILAVLDRAQEMKKSPPRDILEGYLMGSCFFEPSTRTRLSFEAAMRRLGGGVIGFSEAGNTAVKKGESLHDSIKVIGQYSDVVVIRHPLEGAAHQAAEATDKPVINAGDGANEHPTQTLLDLFTIRECQGTLQGLNVAFVGDLLYGRAVHSLVHALRHFTTRFFFVSPEALKLPESIYQELKRAGISFSCHEHLEEVLDKVDILYMTRVQNERMLQNIEEPYVLTAEMVQKGRANLKVLHPLPRNREIEASVDATPYAHYFQQAENGLFVRQALLAMVLGK